MKQFILILFISLLFSSCSITKMRYNRGFNISFIESRGTENCEKNIRNCAASKIRKAPEYEPQFSFDDSVKSIPLLKVNTPEVLKQSSSKKKKEIINNYLINPVSKAKNASTQNKNRKSNSLTQASSILSLFSLVGGIILIASAAFNPVGLIFFLMNIPALILAIVSWIKDRETKNKAILLICVNLLSALAIMAILLPIVFRKIE